ncbi:MalY/PatB family protein [Cetobacterium sp.]|uniref:MalY/PatB family protein n=1 Tax=Cetobacterium sp. TaxID=2071632 RepID=UPI002FC8CE43
MDKLFENYIERRGTDSSKWNLEAMASMSGYADEESIPLWVADMDFKAPEIVIKKLKERIEHGVFGYNMPTTKYYESLNYWYSKRYKWNLEKDWIVTTPGVVPALHYIVQAFSKEGDGVIIQTPVYYPFKKSIENNKREVVENRLIERDREYFIDFEDLEEKTKNPKNKIMILSSPHNPVGRIWKKEELEKIGEICLRNNVLLISDEIHSDLILFNNKFISFGNLSESFLNHSIVCTAPSKTFNLAGLQTSNIIIPNEDIRNTLKNFLITISAKITPNIFGNIAVEAVYSEEGEQWLEKLKDHLEKNYIFMKEYFEKYLPKVKCTELQGTYLAWVDFREVDSFITGKELEDKIAKEAKVVLDGGSIFGDQGAGFMRVNIACHRDTLEEALKRICNIFL